MQRTITLTTQGLKMPACNDFVEHLWKPGSCKNCFHPKSDHRKKHQAPADRKASNLPALPSLNGIRIKQENTNQDDDIVIAALYSKPTIAVKPTMITSETAEEWAALNSTETHTQVSWKESSTSKSILKSGEISNVMDNFTKPFMHRSNSYSDTPKYIFNGLSNHDKKLEFNAVQNLTYVSHFGGQVDKAVFLKEKLRAPSVECTLLSTQSNEGETKKLNYLQAESALLSLKTSSGHYVGTQSIAERLSSNGTLHSKDNIVGELFAKTDPGLCNQTISANDSKPGHNSEPASSKSMFFSRTKVSLHSESHKLSETLSCLSMKDSPLVSPAITDSQSEFQSPVVPVDRRDNEPIYAESTKRKGVAGKGTKNVIQTAKANSKHEENGAKENQCSVSVERVVQESTTHVAAKITVMAAHTEEDNRTIFLSSPDSAVGVEWSCSSPSSVENVSLSPTFLWAERNRGKVDVNKKYQASLSQKFQCSSSLVVPAKSPKFEEFSSSRLSSPTHSPGIFSPTSHKKEPFELNDRCLLTGDRRQRIAQATWSRIDEEEEEETSPASSQPQTNAVSNGQTGATRHIADEIDNVDEPRALNGMSKSASCPIELSKASNDSEDSSGPPPPPPKKQTRLLKMNKNSCELENVSLGSVESLGESFKATNVSTSNVNINVSFSTGSMDSLDSRTCSEGGQSCEAITSPSLSSGIEKKHFAQVSFSVDSGMEAQNGLGQPPPLPVKKSMNRAISAPDNSAWGRAFPSRTGVNPNSPKHNLSQSENNVCGEESTLHSHPLSPMDRHAMFSSSESLEICCRGTGHRNEVRSRNCLQSRGTPAMSMSQLSVSSQTSSASSLQLHHLLSNIDSKEGMYAKLSGLYAQSTRRLMNKCEDYFMRDQKKELRFNENNWSLFKLTSNKPCCNAGDAVYYCATCAKDALNNYAVKLCRAEDPKTPFYSNLSLPVHFNIQQDCGHFLASVPSSLLHPSGTSKGGSTNETSQAVGLSSEEDCVVVITREVPYSTAAEFVKESASTHETQPEIYERQVCLLLLQLCNGLEHLKEHAIIHRDLCLENLLLVHCQTTPDKIKDGKYVPRLIVSNFSKAKQRPGSEDSKLKRDKTRLAPEIMAASQYKKFDEFQTGILIYELLHQRNPFEVRSSLHEHEYSQKDLPPLRNLSVYSRGLQHLAHLLLEADPIKRIRISEAKRILQCLLWGPRKDLTDQPFSHEEALHCALQNWIDMKRALLMMKFAERALEPEHNISLEDWLCCQYLASADPCYLYKTLKLIKLIT
ncbi:inactive tyrosine-protein kinase PRAG1 [Bufo gargarizans]|uniref:inactive tyrosine-protein kinase PRAG1 n=1 Tax=Bufo gargarizans TaxID=30331 RepID=UPI001CF35CEE|nr:inactive tyrosine-protein kinase PRAG1 [Bufo gargarizans]